MVDFQDPAVIEKDFLAVVKLWHVVDGIFIWEFFLSLDYELSIIRGRRPYRWTIWIYSLTRICTLIAVILNMLGFDSSTPINCQLWVIFELLFGSSAFAAASILIVLRIIAIWDGNRIAVAIAICAWNTNVAFLIHNMTRLRAAWAPAQSVCEVLNPESSKSNVITSLVTDVVLLLIVLVGLVRMRLHGNTKFGLGQVLWSQGLIWLFLATITELPPAVFIGLNLNGPFDYMFQTPAIIGMTIAATRMYRSLSDFTSSSGAFDACATRNITNTDPKRMFASPIPLGRVKVAVHTTSEGYPRANIGQYASYDPDSDSQSQDKHLVLSIGSDLENGFKGG